MSTFYYLSKTFSLTILTLSFVLFIVLTPNRLDASLLAQRAPILFVHGYGLSSSSFDTMANDLIARGYPEEYIGKIDLSPNDGANIPAAENQIAPFVESYLNQVNQYLATSHPELSPKQKVDIVSHSMGSLSARWYAARIRPDRVDKWISLAGANHGSSRSYFSKLTTGGDHDLYPAYAASEAESYIQYQLNGAPYIADVDETPYGIGEDSVGVARMSPDATRRILYVTVSATQDVWINPDESVQLDGTGGVDIPISSELPVNLLSVGNYQMTNGIGHDPMLSDPETIQLVSEILAASTETAVPLPPSFGFLIVGFTITLIVRHKSKRQAS